jgi:p-aminobenzoyl-glutamate transporter AbgT
VVGFFVLVWIALVAILVLAQKVYTQTLQKVDGKSLAIEASLLIALSALIAILVVGPGLCYLTSVRALNRTSDVVVTFAPT